MCSISYIINGDSITLDELKKLSNHLANLNDADFTVCEIILYFNTKPELKLDEIKGVTYVISRPKNISSIEKSIAIASGDKLILTTWSNILADKSNYIAYQANDLNHHHLGVPMKRNKIDRLLGIRRISKAGYIIASKSFANDNAKTFTKPLTSIIKANNQLTLLALTPPHITLPEYIIFNTVFFRPTLIILKTLYYVRQQKWRDKRAAMRAAKLSKQVSRTPYSPSIPVFIICRDRVEPLKKLVDWCEAEGLKNIYLIDNASTYPPLLKYYSNTPYEVLYLGRNIGHTSPWATGIVNIYAKGRPYIVSDPDVIPSDKAHGAVKRFADLLNNNPVRRKVGFGLRIDNLPDDYALKEYVVNWESQFWVSEVEPDVYDAEIDTTFALYRPNTPYVLGPALRTGGKYTAEHEPWYIDSKKIPEEVKYYREHADKIIGSWGIETHDVTQTYANFNIKTDRP